MVHAHHAAPDGRAAEVVDGQVGAALVLVLEPAEAAALARLAVARQLEEDGFAELGEDGDDVALGELEREAAEEDEGGVAVVDMPGGIGGAGSARRRGSVVGADRKVERESQDLQSLLNLLLVELLDGAYLVHGGQGGVPRQPGLCVGSGSAK